MGKVLDIQDDVSGSIKVGDTVFFDSWRCAKYPTGQQDDNGEEMYFWLVPFGDIRAYEPSLPEQHL